MAIKISDEEFIKKTLEQVLSDINFEAYLFGSQVTEKAQKSSDLDLLIKGNEPISFEKLSKLNEKFEESSMPVRVDIVDFFNLNEDFKKSIFKSIKKIYP